jgi:glycosyltransferase involved in cell wall biosynthesis
MTGAPDNGNAAARPAVPGPSSPEPAASVPLPRGFGVTLDPDTRQLSDGSLFGGSPARVLRLTDLGQQALAELRAGPVSSAAAGVLARRLTDAGIAHPTSPTAACPGELAGERAGQRLDVTVVIPVRDRAAMLDRCLTAAGSRYPVVVIDDGSADPAAITAVARRHGAIVRRLASGAGPGAARNAGLAGLGTDLVAFLDSDCKPPPGWIDALAVHLADPLVGAIAPRIIALTTSSAAGRYEQARGSLDLGSRPARVVPASRVAYVPTAALLVRRAALESVAGSFSHAPPELTGTTDVSDLSDVPAEPAKTLGVFDPRLRYGEDVDLIWRLNDAGWRIRYEPSVQVPHDSPADWRGLLARRFRYGTSAAPLARRHPANMAPLVLQPWPAVTVASAIARRPTAAVAAAFAVAGTVGAWLDIATTVRRAGVPGDGAPAATLTAIRQTWLGIGRYATQFAAPLLAIALLAPGRRSTGPGSSESGSSGPGSAVSGSAGHGLSRRGSAGRRAVAASLLVGPALSAYAERKPELDPLRYTLGHLADDICYGAGVWVGCLRERTLVPVRPVIAWRPVRITRP